VLSPTTCSKVALLLSRPEVKGSTVVALQMPSRDDLVT